MKTTEKIIFNVYNPDNIRIGEIKMVEVRRFLRKTLTRFCYSGKNGFGPAFFGWSTEESVRNYIQERYPKAKILKHNEMDEALNFIETTLSL